MSLSSVLVTFTADITQLQNNLRDALRDIDTAGDRAGDSGNRAGSAFDRLRATAIPALAQIAAAIGATTAALNGIKYNANMEQSLMSYETLLGSAQKAKSMVADLQKFGATTPFEFQGLDKSAKTMLAMGFNANDIMPNLQKVGDAVAAIGGNDETLTGVSMALSQMLTKGKVSAEEMNQLAERGIPAWEIMAQKMGMSKRELMDLSAAGKVMADEALPALIDGMGEKYSGAMEKQSKTFSGMMSTLKDNANIFMGQVMEPIFNKLKDLLPGAIEGVEKLGEAFTSASSFIKGNWETIVPILSGVAAVIGFLYTKLVLIPAVLSAVTTATAAWGAITGAVTATIIAVPLAIAAVVAAGVYLYRNWGEVKAKLSSCWQSIATTASSVFNGIKNFFTSIWQGIVSVFTSAATSLSTKTSEVVNKIKETWNTGFNAVKTLVTQAWEGIKSVFNSAIQAITQALSSAWQKIQSIWTSGINSIRSAWQSGLQTIQSLASSAINAILSVFQSAPSRVASAFASIVSSARQYLANFASEAASLGRNVVDGFLGSITGAAGRIKDQVAGVMKGAIDSAKSTLGIKSPSRVFKEIGKYTAEGFAVGVDKNSDLALGAVDDMTQGAIKAAESGFSLRPAFSPQVGALASTGGVGYAGSPINVQQLVVREEADIQKIAEELYKLQRRGQRAKGVF